MGGWQGDEIIGPCLSLLWPFHGFISLHANSEIAAFESGLGHYRITGPVFHAIEAYPNALIAL